MAHVLIGFAEALPAPEVVFSLKTAGHTVSAFARRGDLPVARLLNGALHVIAAPEEDAEAAIAALQALVAADPDMIVLPLDDAGLWVVRAAAPAQVAGAQGTQADVALDKAAQVAAARRAGLAVPPTVVIERPEDLEKVVTFPVILKPALAERARDGKLGRGKAVYVASPDARDATGKELFSPMLEPYLAQPLIAGVGEGVFGFATAQGVVAWSGHRRVRMMNPHGSGSSACRVLAPSPDLTDRIAAFLADIGWRGPFMVELLRDAEGTAWFMELNGRMWGSMALARRQGFEYPAWSVAAVTDPDFVPRPEARPLPVPVMRHLGRDLLHLAFVLRGPESGFHKAGWPRFWRSAAAVLRPGPGRGFYNYDPAHRFYMLRDALWTVRQRFRRGGG